MVDSTPFRSSLRSPLSEYLHAFPRILSWPVFIALWMERDQGPFRTIILVALSGILVLELFVPISQWASTTYVLTELNIQRRSGILRRVALTMTWRQVSSVDDTANWSQRLFKISTLSIAQESDQHRTLIIRGVGVQTVDLVRRCLPNLPQTTQESTSIVIPDAPRISVSSDKPVVFDGAENTLYRATLRELTVTSLLNGKAVVFAPSVLLAVWGWIDEMPFSGSISKMISALPGALVIAVCIVVGLLGGIATACVRYLGFTAAIDKDGAVTIHHGWFERRSRTVSAASIQGTVMTANPLELLIGRARVRLFTSDMGPLSDGNTIFPPMPIQRLISTEMVSLPPDSLSSSHHRIRHATLLAFLSMLLCGGIPVVGFLVSGYLTQNYSWHALVPFLFAALLVCSWLPLVRVLTTTIGLSDDGEYILIRSVMPTYRYSRLKRECLHGISVVALLPHVFTRHMVTVAMFSGGVRRFRTLACTDAQVERMRSGMFGDLQSVLRNVE